MVYLDYLFMYSVVGIDRYALEYVMLKSIIQVTVMFWRFWYFLFHMEVCSLR